MTKPQALDIVAMLYAILALKQTGAKLKGRIVLTLVPNEETGGEGGSAWLAREGLLGGTFSGFGGQGCRDLGSDGQG